MTAPKSSGMVEVWPERQGRITRWIVADNGNIIKLFHFRTAAETFATALAQQNDKIVKFRKD